MRTRTGIAVFVAAVLCALTGDWFFSVAHTPSLQFLTGCTFAAATLIAALATVWLLLGEEHRVEELYSIGALLANIALCLAAFAFGALTEPFTAYDARASLWNVPSLAFVLLLLDALPFIVLVSRNVLCPAPRADVS